MAAKNVTTEVVLDRADAQRDRLFDLQAMLQGATAICPGEAGDYPQRLLRQATELVDEVLEALDSVTLRRPPEDAAAAQA